MQRGETILSGAPDTCDCGRKFKFKVLSSAAGYYIGTSCDNPECDYYCMPNSRETGYWSIQHGAELALEMYKETGRLLNRRTS